MSIIGGNALPMYVIRDSDLRENGGQFQIEGRAAVPIYNMGDVPSGSDLDAGQVPQWNGSAFVGVDAVTTDNLASVISADADNALELGSDSKLFAASGDQEYLEYVATLSGFTDGNGPSTVTVLKNTFGGPVVWARAIEGLYTGTLTGAFPTAAKISASIIAGGIYLFIFDRLDDNTIYFGSYAGFVNPTDITNSATPVRIQIRVYP